MRRQAAWLKKYPEVTVQVEGHADERGTREYNIALSARRVTAAREFLIAQGVPAKRIGQATRRLSVDDLDIAELVPPKFARARRDPVTRAGTNTAPIEGARR